MMTTPTPLTENAVSADAQTPVQTPVQTPAHKPAHPDYLPWAPVPERPSQAQCEAAFGAVRKSATEAARTMAQEQFRVTVMDHDAHPYALVVQPATQGDPRDRAWICLAVCPPTPGSFEQVHPRTLSWAELDLTRRPAPEAPLFSAEQPSELPDPEAGDNARFGLIELLSWRSLPARQLQAGLGSQGFKVKGPGGA